MVCLSAQVGGVSLGLSFSGAEVFGAGEFLTNSSKMTLYETHEKGYYVLERISSQAMCSLMLTAVTACFIYFL